MDQFQQYLKERIASHLATHREVKQQEKQAKESLHIEMAAAYNAMAAGVWDTKTELESVLQMYNRLYMEPVDVANPHGDDDYAIPEHLKDTAL